MKDKPVGPVSRPRATLVVNLRKPLPGWLLDSLDGDLVGMTEPPYREFFPADCQVILVSNLRDGVEVAAAVARLLEEISLDRVVSPSEHGIAAAGIARSLAGVAGAGASVAATASDKLAMKTALVDAGFAVASFEGADTLGDIGAAAARVGYPVIVKPVFGGGGLDIFRFDTPDSLARGITDAAGEALAATRVPFIVESALELTAEFHCDGVVVGGTIAFCSVSRYFDPVLPAMSRHERIGSFTLPPQDPLFATLSDLHLRVVSALGIHDAVTHLEVLETSEGLLVGEIAIRPAGGGIPRGIELSWGVDLWDAWRSVELGTGTTPSPSFSGLIANADLPVQPGRISQMSSEADLRALPGVVAVELVHDVGDIIGTRFHSSTASGVAYIAASDGVELMERVDAVYAAFISESTAIPDHDAQ